MGKSDQSNVQGDINTAKRSALDQSQQGITESQGDRSAAQAQNKSEHSSIWDAATGLSGDPNLGISQADRDRLLGGGGGSSGGGGGGPVPADTRFTGNPLQSATGDYRDVYADLIKNPFDKARLDQINSAQSRLLDTSGNYGDVNTSVTGLQNFAKTGGVSDAEAAQINRASLSELENTGGYSEADKGNLRARGNSAIASTYGNLQDQLQRQKLVGNNIGPGWSAAGFKLARQGAQDIGTNARTTEADIADRVAANRLAAGTSLANANLGLQGLRSTNTLQGYKTAGDLGLGRQSQIDAATAASAGIGLNTQGLQNQSRLGATSALGNDVLSRLQMQSNEAVAAANRAASAGAARAALDAANQRFLISEGDQNRLAALGLQNSLDARSSNEFGDANSLLYNYRGAQANQQNQFINSEIANNASNRTDWMGNIGKGLGAAGSALSFFPMGGGYGGENPAGNAGGVDAGGFPLIPYPDPYGGGGDPYTGNTPRP